MGRVVTTWVSICQADLGLAEHAAEIAPQPLVTVSICQADLGLAEHRNLAGEATHRTSFNLPGRFGFGRTGAVGRDELRRAMFQSARQIWVWPNRARAPGRAGDVAVSICQADLGLAELYLARNRSDAIEMFQSARQIWVWPNGGAGAGVLEHEQVSICQADLGLAELG